MVKNLITDSDLLGMTQIIHTGKYTSNDQSISFDYKITHEIETKEYYRIESLESPGYFERYSMLLLEQEARKVI